MNANISKLILNILIAVFVAVGCVSQSRVVDMDDFTVVKYSPKYASGFEVLSLPDSSATLVRIVRPWQGAQNNEHHLLIVGEGVSAPDGFVGAVVTGEARRIVAMSSGSIAMLDMVGEADRVVGVSGIDYITSTTIHDLADEGKLYDVGYGSNLNFEIIVAQCPDLVLLYGVTGEDRSVTAKLSELGIPYIYIGDYAEESPLAKAEWVVAMGEICGVSALAQERFEGVAERYETLRAMVSSQVVERPKVMLNAPYRDVWYMPSSDNYIVRLIEDGGGDYIYDGNTSGSTQPISIETAYGLMSQADMWLNMGAMSRTVDELKAANPKFQNMPSVVDGQLYNMTARGTEAGGSDFWESGMVRPDVVLADMVRIMQPHMLPDHELYYYERLR